MVTNHFAVHTEFSEIYLLSLKIFNTRLQLLQFSIILCLQQAHTPQQVDAPSKKKSLYSSTAIAIAQNNVIGLSIPQQHKHIQIL